MLGCQSLRGPLGLSLGFYRARVRCLDVAHLNYDSEGELGLPKHGWSAILPHTLYFVRAFSIMGGGFKHAGHYGIMPGWRHSLRVLGSSRVRVVAVQGTEEKDGAPSCKSCRRLCCA